MRCPACNSENLLGQKFCGDCGAHLGQSCPSCGHFYTLGQKFCGECGGSLPIAGVFAAQHAVHGQTPSDYTPPHLVQRILSSRYTMEGERKQVTVLFADLKGSMEILAHRDPEQAREILGEVVRHMMSAVHRYEGTVNQVMGDGIMALFGAPIANEDHAVRACLAAVDLQQSASQFAQSHVVESPVTLAVRVGINSGEVVVGGIGSDLRMEYTAMGATTHLAARLEQTAMPGTTLISAATMRLAEGYVTAKPPTRIPIKGLAEPVDVYELIGSTSARSRLQAAVANRGLTGFVGRSHEMDVLADALQRAGRGKGEIVAMVGEPGMGKSRLAWEFIRSPQVEGWTVLQSGSVSYGKASAYRPIIDLLKSYFCVGDEDDGRAIREKVAVRLIELGAQVESLLTPLLSLLDVSHDDREWETLEPSERRLRLLDACKRLLFAEAEVQPLLVLVEDLHWIDNQTQSVLDQLVDGLPNRRMLLLVNYRPEYFHRWGTRSYYTQLRIDPLMPGNAEELLDELIGKDSSMGPLRQLLVERTACNALFLEESVRRLIETGVLVGHLRAYRLERPIERIEVAATVQSVLAARIDQLDTDDKRLLQVAAVIGKDVPYSLLRTISQLSEQQLRRGLGSLQAREFVYEASSFPDAEFSFKHALTHEVAYASLLQERRRELHGRILDAVRELYPDRLQEKAEVLGHHALRAERWPEAADHLRDAGLKAFNRSANREAVNLLEGVLEALEHLPQTNDVIAQQVDVRLALRECLLPLGDMHRLVENARAAGMLARSLDDPAREALILGFQAGPLSVLGQLDEAAQHAARSLHFAESLNEPALVMISRFFVAQVEHYRGNFRRALSLYKGEVAARTETLLAQAEAQADHGLLYSSATSYGVIQTTCNCGDCYMELGEFEAALACVLEAGRIAAAAKKSWVQTNTAARAARIQLRQGEFYLAIEPIKKVIESARRSEASSTFFMACADLGAAYTFLAQPMDAIPLLENAAESERTGERYWAMIPALSALGQSLAMIGQEERARACVDRGLELSRDSGFRGLEAWALYRRAAVLSYAVKFDPDEVRESYLEALALATSLCMSPLVAHCRIGLAEIYRRIHLDEEGDELTRVAGADFDKMKMRFFKERIEKLPSKTSLSISSSDKELRQ